MHQTKSEDGGYSGAGGQAASALQESIDVGVVPNGKPVPPHHTETLPCISEERRARSLKDSAFEVDNFVDDVSRLSEQDQKSETVLYLAYGSNLSAETFRGKRGIEPLAQLNVVVPEITLTFDLPGIPYVEPCFANVRYRDDTTSRQTSPDPEKTPLLPQQQQPAYNKDHWKKGLVGVVYEVTKKDYATIIATEGGGSSYQDVAVLCYPLARTDVVPEKPDSAPFKAHTLYAPADRTAVSPLRPSSWSRRLHRPDPGYAQASPRYMKLLTDGAEEHHLPREYKSFLCSIHAYRITQNRQRLGKYIFFGIWFPIVMTVFKARDLFSDKEGRSPKWFQRLTGAVFTGCWASYDRFFKRLFGDGERTIGDKQDYFGRTSAP
ncbi:MAG: hypothetical protein M1817_001753 [Caeruleum heppii]|nr:MAG: hypothetical protein M1817_001753 [Caeruleum heppii]